MLTNENFTLPTFSSIQVATISTVNSGYGIFYAICTNNETDLLSIKCMLNAKFVSYNQTSSERVAVLYELSRNVNISGLYCDLVSVGLGHVCTLVIDSSSTPTTSSGLLGDYGKAIIPLILAASANGVIYFMSQTGNVNEANQLNETRNKAGDLTENINQKASKFNLKMAANLFSGGLFVFSHSAFSTTFSFSDVNSKPEFKLPSETSAIINRVKIFDKVNGFEKKVKFRAFLDTFIKNVPQLVIQILYFNSIVTYSIIPFLTLCTTVFMICLTCVRSTFDFFKEGKKNENNEVINEKKDNKWVAERVKEWINDEKGNTEDIQ
ncbi:7572_t:CDS:2 [Gigaspora rosea]|nr:7572_t:CDS:2 [Gigaspora rosea]